MFNLFYLQMLEIEKQVFISKTKNVLHNIGTCIRNVLYMAKNY